MSSTWLKLVRQQHGNMKAASILYRSAGHMTLQSMSPDLLAHIQNLTEAPPASKPVARAWNTPRVRCSNIKNVKANSKNTRCIDAGDYFHHFSGHLGTLQQIVHRVLKKKTLFINLACNFDASTLQEISACVSPSVTHLCIAATVDSQRKRNKDAHTAFIASFEPVVLTLSRPGRLYNARVFVLNAIGARLIEHLVIPIDSCQHTYFKTVDWTRFKSLKTITLNSNGFTWPEKTMREFRSFLPLGVTITRVDESTW